MQKNSETPIQFKHLNKPFGETSERHIYKNGLQKKINFVVSTLSHDYKYNVKSEFTFHYH